MINNAIIPVGNPEGTNSLLEPQSRVTLKIFAVLVVRDNHVVLILNVFKLVSFFYIYPYKQATKQRVSLKTNDSFHIKVSDWICTIGII